MKKWFNSHIKEEFLSQYTEGTQTTYQRVFESSKDIEEIKGYDLYDFSLDEVREVVENANPKSPASARSMGSTISKYITWAAKYKSSNINEMQGVSPKFFENIVADRELFINETTLQEIIYGLVNPQDQVIVKLIFLSVSGYRYSELLNLTYKHINRDENILRLVDDRKNERFLKVDEATISLIDRALRQQEYMPRNGESERKTKQPLVKNPYVVRSVLRKAKYLERAEMNCILRRISNISEVFEKPYLTPKNIWKSGQIKMAADLYKRDGEIGTDQLNEIAEAYNLSKISNNGYEMYAITQMKDYINAKNLKQLYNIDVEI
jgi:integrase